MSHSSHPELDQDTFDVLWKLSEPGSAAEGCFLRHTQTEYRGDDLPNAEWLQYMPDVRNRLSHVHSPSF